MKTKKVKRRKFSFKKFFKFLLFLIIIISLIYLLSKEPIKHIKVLGTNKISDDEIIEAAGIENYPSYLTTSSKIIENKIKKLDLVNNVKVKKKWGFVYLLLKKENKI